MKKTLLLAATNYLTMRGFNVKELGYSSSKYRIDIIAEKNSTPYFIKILDTKSDLDYEKALKLAAGRYLDETKYSGSYRLGSITIDHGSQSILGFNT